MKRLWYIPVLLVLITAICVTGISIINHKTQQMDEMLDRAAECMEQGDLQQASEWTQELYDYWEKAEKQMTAFVQTDNLEFLSQSIAELRHMTTEEQKDEFMSVYGECSSILEGLRESERLSWRMFL